MAGFRRERTCMGSQEARVAVEAVEDMVWTRCWGDGCGGEWRVRAVNGVVLQDVVSIAI